MNTKNKEQYNANWRILHLNKNGCLHDISMSDPNTQVVDTRTGEILKPFGVTITKT